MGECEKILTNMGICLLNLDVTSFYFVYNPIFDT